MRTYRTKQILVSKTSKTSVDTNVFIKVNIDSQKHLLPPDKINKVVNIGEQFNLERKTSGYYRILGTINSCISNVLFNLNNSDNEGDFTWAKLNDSLLLDNLGDLINYSDSINKNLLEIDGWFGYMDPDISKSNLCPFFDMEPKRQRFSFVPDINSFNTSPTPIKNWELTVTYPKTMDKTHGLVNGGLLIIDQIPITISNRSMVGFGVAVLHNLNVGDTVNITGTSNYNGIHEVVSVGVGNGDNKGYYFVIDKPLSGNINQFSRFKKIIGGVESEYYFRIFTKVGTRNNVIIENDDYETYKLAFSENIYSEPNTQFVFNEDININGLTDNLGRPLSELYVTTIKTSSDDLFTSVSSGIETPFISSLNQSNLSPYLSVVPCIQKIHNGGSLPFQSHIPLETDIVIDDNDFYGDLVEYNSLTVKETILVTVSHRFNTINRETTASLTYNTNTILPIIKETIGLGPRQEGYFFNPHSIIKIRDFSSYIEEGDSFTVGVPEYAVKLIDGRYLWRDLLDIGFNETDVKPLDYPFLNGCHYIYNNYNFNVRRQDPFNLWGLRYDTFPSDPKGDTMTDNFTINSTDEPC